MKRKKESSKVKKDSKKEREMEIKGMAS